MHPPSLIEARQTGVADQEKSIASGLPAKSEFESVLQRHSAMVLGVCRRMLPNADAEDAAQAVFVLLWRRDSVIRTSHISPGGYIAPRNTSVGMQSGPASQGFATNRMPRRNCP